MSQKLDVFAHILPPDFYQRMLVLEPTLPKKYPFIQIPTLLDVTARKKHFLSDEQQVISVANINPEDYVNPQLAQELVWAANQELAEIVATNKQYFYAGIGMVAMSNLTGALEIMEKQIAPNPNLLGIQVFTRALGKSIADVAYRKLFAKAEELGLLVLLHPVFDERKVDNNLIFSWEYELSQAMLALVKGGIFQAYPNLKIVVHHAGAMVSFFSERINHILSPTEAADFKKFYVDTALLGNTKALELAATYFGVDHLLYGTDAPFGKMPAGANSEIRKAVEEMELDEAAKQAIFRDNLLTLVKRGESDGSATI